jgi:hypothetical protein
MNVKELLETLKTVHPETQVRVWADHGQSCMLATTAGLQHISKNDINEYTCDIINQEDITEEDETVQIFEIGAP